MASDAIEAKFRAVIAAVADVLKTAGFKKAGAKFRRQNNGNLELIEFQRSMSNDRGRMRFTANIGVISGKVLRTLDPEADIQKLGVWAAHLNERLGYFRDEPSDHWWPLSSDTDEVRVAAEIEEIITAQVLPFLAEHASDRGLAKLWRSGKSPGLTEFQRARNLAALS